MAGVLDTTFLVDLSRADQAARSLLEELADRDEPLLIPAIVVAEYLAGSQDPNHDLERLRRAGEILAFTLEDARAAAQVAQETLEAGRFPGWSDAFIAGVARHRGNLAVVTRNQDHYPASDVLGY